MGIATCCSPYGKFSNKNWDDNRINQILNEEATNNKNLKAIFLLSGDGGFLDTLNRIIKEDNVQVIVICKQRNLNGCYESHPKITTIDLTAIDGMNLANSSGNTARIQKIIDDANAKKIKKPTFSGRF